MMTAVSTRKYPKFKDMIERGEKIMMMCQSELEIS